MNLSISLLRENVCAKVERRKLACIALFPQCRLPAVRVYPLWKLRDCSKRLVHLDCGLVKLSVFVLKNILCCVIPGLSIVVVLIYLIVVEFKYSSLLLSSKVSFFDLRVVCLNAFIVRSVSRDKASFRRQWFNYRISEVVLKLIVYILRKRRLFRLLPYLRHES